MSGAAAGQLTERADPQAQDAQELFQPDLACEGGLHERTAAPPGPADRAAAGPGTCQ